jgi:hypothetical protein
MVDILLIFIFLLMAAPVALIILGIAQLIGGSNDLDRKRGKQNLLTGVILLGVEILIGFSVCSHGIG